MLGGRLQSHLVGRMKWNPIQRRNVGNKIRRMLATDITCYKSFGYEDLEPPASRI